MIYHFSGSKRDGVLNALQIFKTPIAPIVANLRDRLIAETKRKRKMRELLKVKGIRGRILFK